MTLPTELWALLAIFLCGVLMLYRNVLSCLLRLLVRSCCSMTALAVLARIPALSSIALGVNPVNGLIIGVLGLPGFALLLLLRWTLT